MKAKPPPKKKIKKEPGVSCLVCEERFEKISFRDAHMVANHRPLTSEYGCSSCLEQFSSIEEYTSHHDWHSMFNVPHKCTLCGAIFEKLITFQRHVSACVNQSYALMTSFSKSIFCELCNVEYETQNLYDWHNCFIGQNSPCPKCQRVFTKKTVLMKHMFKCTGPGSVVEAPKKPVTASKSKKQKQPTKSKGETTSQNCIKFEPETIIEPADEAYDDEMDNSYMDTHFGDSDDELGANDSIIAPIEPIVELSTGASTSEINTPSHSNARKSTTCTSLNANVNTKIRTNMPLLECRVKLEPIDISNYAIPSTSTSMEPVDNRSPTVPPLVISRQTVPPLTIRIKKEIIQPGYGDDFNSQLTHNIKQERVDETYELAGTSREEYSISHKKSKHREKEKKLYKKPALLAIKIKQERMERDDNDENESEPYYPDYSMPSTDFSSTIPNQSFDNNPLPIITQIHSVLEPPAISSSTSVQLGNQQSPITTISLGINPLANSIPFVPIRIKSEFQKPLTPPPPPLVEEDNEHLINNSDGTTTKDATMEGQIPNVNESKSECDMNLSSSTDLNQQSDSTFVDVTSVTNQENNTINSVDDSNEISSNKYIANSEISEQELNRTEPVSSTVDALCEQPSKLIDENNSIESEVKNQQEIIEDKSLSENVLNIQHLPKDEEENEIQRNDNTFSTQAMDISMENNEILDKQIENRIDKEIETIDKNMVSAEENLTDYNDQNTSFIPQTAEINEQIENVLNAESEIDSNLIKPICDDLDSIDFIEPNTNDDSLNFIDQLVHEVADTMVSQISDLDKSVESNEISSQENLNIQLEIAQIEHNVGGSSENQGNVANIVNESISDSNSKSTENDTLLALSDIDYSANLLPVINITESKTNGNNIPINPPVQINSTQNAEQAESVDINLPNEIDPSNLPLNDPNYQENVSN